MAQDISEYYDGSRTFTWLSDFCGISIDQINFVISQILALLLASLFRTVFHPSKTSAATRHGFGLIFALIIGYFCFGMQAIHLAGLPALSYIVIKTQNPEIMQRMVLIVALLYLSIVHLHRQIYDYGSYSLDITGPLMIITQKVTSLAFNIHDGLTKSDSEMTKSQKLYAITKLPNTLEYFSFTLQFPSLMAGPAMFYKEYIDFIDGKNYLPQATSINDESRNSKTIIIEPSPIRAVYKKVVLALIYVIVFIKILPQFPISRLKNGEFLENTSLMYKFWYLNLCTTLVRFKYYFAWTVADAICNNAGIGFNGFNSDGTSNWDKFSNVDLIKFEFGTNLRESIEAWNVGTNRWLRIVVYERTKKYSIILTYALSALWHGFYPGYYITFASGALFTFAARIMRRTVRDYFVGNAETKRVYDIVTFVVSKLVMAYITFPFILLGFWPSIQLYMQMYWCLHIIAILAIFLVPKIILKADNECLATKNSIAQALSQARPITNGVSRHHD